MLAEGVALNFLFLMLTFGTDDCLPVPKNLN